MNDVYPKPLCKLTFNVSPHTYKCKEKWMNITKLHQDVVKAVAYPAFTILFLQSPSLS